MRKNIPILIVGVMFAQVAYGQEDGACFEQAAKRYRVSAQILKSISRVESGGNPAAFHRNANGSLDIGHMQINSAWLPTLARYGITRDHLTNSCVNTHVGAWILANNFQRMGYGWNAIGAYNAKSPDKAAAYARKVAANLRNEEVAID
jgi:soluble lytic murein transglycosylase-like protein